MRLENEYQAVKFKKANGAEFIPYTYFRDALGILLLVMITLLGESKRWTKRGGNPARPDGPES